MPPRQRGDTANTTSRLFAFTGAAIAQDKLEPILRSRAAELGAGMRYSTELISFEQDENGVSVHVSVPGEGAVPADSSPSDKSLFSLLARDYLS